MTLGVVGSLVTTCLLETNQQRARMIYPSRPPASNRSIHLSELNRAETADRGSRLPTWAFNANLDSECAVSRSFDLLRRKIGKCLKTDSLSILQAVRTARAILMLAAIAAEAFGQNNWPVYGHDFGGMRFSPLHQINVTNVDRLRRAWTYHTGEHPSTTGPRGQPAGCVRDDSTGCRRSAVPFHARESHRGSRSCFGPRTVEVQSTIKSRRRAEVSRAPRSGVLAWRRAESATCPLRHIGWTPYRTERQDGP